MGKSKPKLSKKAPDSDQFFRCSGNPGDLLEDDLSPKESPMPNQKVLYLPDEENYYLYDSGLRRQSCSTASDRTAAVKDLVIRTKPPIFDSSASKTRRLEAILENIPTWNIKGKFRAESEGARDLRGCEKPKDLIEDSRTSLQGVKPNQKEVYLPENENYYLYDAGLHRKSCPTDSDSVKEESRVLVIKTDPEILTTSSPGKSYRPIKFTTAPKLNFMIGRARKISNRPLNLRAPTPNASQASIPETPSTSLSQRRHGLLLSSESLPLALKQLKDVDTINILEKDRNHLDDASECDGKTS